MAPSPDRQSKKAPKPSKKGQKSSDSGNAKNATNRDDTSNKGDKSSNEDRRTLVKFIEKFQDMFEGGIMEAQDYNADIVVWNSEFDKSGKSGKDRFIPRSKLMQYFIEHLVEIYRGLCTQIIHDIKMTENTGQKIIQRTF